MTTYTTIANSEVDQDSPITASLMERLRDNPIAITEGASGAPQIQTAGIADAAVTAAKLGTGVGVWTLVASEQPTSDVGDVTWTGLSSYSRILVVGAISLNGSGYIELQARTSGGTWRDCGGIGITAVSANDPYFFRGEISNMDVASEKVVSWFTATDSGTFDSSDASQYEYTDVRTSFGWVSYDEIWDEVRIDSGTNSINGATADLRGRILIYGITA